MGDIIDLRARIAQKLEQGHASKLAHKILDIFVQADGTAVEELAALVLAARALHEIITEVKDKETADKALLEAYDLADQYQLISPDRGDLDGGKK